MLIFFLEEHPQVSQKSSKSIQSHQYLNGLSPDIFGTNPPCFIVIIEFDTPISLNCTGEEVYHLFRLSLAFVSFLIVWSTALSGLPKCLLTPNRSCSLGPEYTATLLPHHFRKCFSLNRDLVNWLVPTVCSLFVSLSGCFLSLIFSAVYLSVFPGVFFLLYFSQYQQ